MDFILNISVKMEEIFKTDLRSSSQVVFHAGSLYTWFSIEIINSGRIVTTAIKTLLNTVKYDIVRSARVYAGQGYTEQQAQEEWNMILHVLFEEETESSASLESIHEKNDHEKNDHEIDECTSSFETLFEQEPSSTETPKNAKLYALAQKTVQHIEQYGKAPDFNKIIRAHNFIQTIHGTPLKEEEKEEVRLMVIKLLKKK
uniref:Phosphoprotein p30 n=1 Tax=African swine fever virus TaxID=10497 RepID=B9UNE6_ASF|nr:phosphoprotein p30 [African swine fever virus]